MSMTYEYDILRLRKTNTTTSNNIIVGIWWRATGTDSDGITGTFEANSMLPVDDLNPSNFVAYEDLTKEVVVGWIQNLTYLDNFQNYYKDLIKRQIDQKKYTAEDVEPADFPWA